MFAGAGKVCYLLDFSLTSSFNQRFDAHFIIMEPRGDERAVQFDMTTQSTLRDVKQTLFAGYPLAIAIFLFHARNDMRPHADPNQGSLHVA